ncbi:MAG: hypothetical protein K5894_13830 [Lachnospiraceae bacterium]|nr:hypothetical protein [Lachnospiraceae bacterium]
MQSVVGYSKNKDVKAAVEEATSRMKSPVGIIIMSDYQMLPEASRLIHEKFPDAETIGTSGTSYCNTESSDSILVVTAFESEAKCVAGVIKHLATCPIADIGGLQKSVREISAGREDTVCIEYCTNNEERLVSTMDVALGKSGISLIGGTVFGYPANVKGQVTYNGDVYENTCAYILVKNLKGKARVYRENIYGKMDNTPHIATKVNTNEKELIELDHKSAAEVYSSELGIPKDKICDNVLKNPLGRAVEDNIYISSQHTLKPNGTLVNYKSINENDTIYFLKLLDYDDINRVTRETISGDFRNINLVISCNCIFRYVLFNNENYFNTFLNNMSTIGNHVGNIGGGEQFNNQHVNQTMVCAVFD